MQFAILGQALDRCYRRAVGLNTQDRARFDRLPVEHDGTRAAQRRFTADVRTRQLQNVPQIMNKKHAWLDLIRMRDTIHAQIDSLFMSYLTFEDLFLPQRST